jgi:hypothetical protein
MEPSPDAITFGVSSAKLRSVATPSTAWNRAVKQLILE